MASNKIRSIDDLLESLKGTNLIEETMIYRGQSNINWKVQPSILREPVNEKPKIIETALYLPLCQDLEIPFLESKDPIEYLTILQHYGVSTRLLDFSKNPLVALFFSCFEKEISNEDGVFIVTDKRNFCDFTLRKLTNDYFVKKYHDLPKEKYLERINISEIIYFEPVFSNPRSRFQNGCFLLFPFCTITESDLNYITLEEYIRFVNKLNKMNNSENEVFMVYKNIDKKYKKSILLELESKHSISYESLMLPTLTSSEVEIKFKILLSSILNSYSEVEKIYYKNVKTI